MAMLTSSANASFLGTDIGSLVLKPVIEQSIATQVSTVIMSNAASFRVPIVQTDPVSQFVAEGAEIPPSDAVLAEAVVVFKKLAGLTVCSSEILSDASASAEAAQLIGDGLSRDIATRLTAAWLAAATPNGPAGLKSLVTTTTSAGGSWSNSDPFTAATFAAEGLGATVNAWVTGPTDGLALASLKEATGSNRGLLQPDPTQAGRRTIGGIPLFISPSVTAGEVWGIPAQSSLIVIRNDVTVTTDSSAFYTSDRWAIRALLRVGFCFPFPLSIQRVTEA